MEAVLKRQNGLLSIQNKRNWKDVCSSDQRVQVWTKKSNVDLEGKNELWVTHAQEIQRAYQEKES